MAKIITVLLSLAAVGYMASHAVSHRGANGSPETAHRQLENVRVKAQQIERNDLQRAADAEHKADDALAH